MNFFRIPSLYNISCFCYFRNGQLSFRSLYVHRILRILPVLAVVTIFYLTLLKFVANGPNYFTIIDVERNRCEKTAWKTLLFVTNYFDDKVCRLVLDLDDFTLKHSNVLFISALQKLGFLMSTCIYSFWHRF